MQHVRFYDVPKSVDFAVASVKRHSNVDTDARRLMSVMWDNVSSIIPC